jgi:hypothetical protein
MERLKDNSITIAVEVIDNELDIALYGGIPDETGKFQQDLEELLRKYLKREVEDNPM